MTAGMTASLMLGNEALARALADAGCAVVTAYPGTPSSEILSALAAMKVRDGLAMHLEWSVNEKIAFEVAYAASQTGLRAAVCMKQVGLNVAADPLMSAVYSGCEGAFVVISADDPGPHSSQTEQDSRLMAMLARIPVLDPSTPADAAALTADACRLSEAYRIPVMLRPTTRVCHACQDVVPGKPVRGIPDARFEKDPARWAATPKMRYQLHRVLEDKLAAIAADAGTMPRRIAGRDGARLAVVSSGVACAHAIELFGRSDIADRAVLFKVVQPFPLHRAFTDELLASFDSILVIEETMPVIEMQLADRTRVRGRTSGDIPPAGELLPETVAGAITRFIGLPADVVPVPEASAKDRRPTLCAGCPHRASFHAIRKAAPHAIYPGDIGCYTLGLNMAAVDTVLCMGASISQAAGFHHAYRLSGSPREIVATIGDSTFFHAGLPALVNAVVQDARFVLVILDNATTAMTGNQPTPATGRGADGGVTATVAIEPIVEAAGVRFVRTADPLQVEAFTELLREAVAFSRDEGLAVVIARSPCIVGTRMPRKSPPVTDAARCNGCRYCIEKFECPALGMAAGSEVMTIDGGLCNGCGVCISVCPRNAITATGPSS